MTAPASIIEIDNSQEGLAYLQQEAESLLLEAGASEQVRFTVQLAVEEVVTNVIHYAFDDRLPHRIRVELRITPQAIELNVEDDGREFNPCAQPPVRIDLPMEQRPIGGLGIHLVRELASDVRYQRVQGRNRLEIRFPSVNQIPPSQVEQPGRADTPTHSSASGVPSFGLRENEP